LPIKGVIFDLDDTLYTMVGIHDAALAQARRRACALLSISQEVYDEAFGTARAQILSELHATAASHSRLLWFQRMCELLGKPPFESALELERAYWDFFLSRIKPKEGARELLAFLKESGVRTAVCTDMQAQVQLRKLRALGLDSLVNFLVSSEEAGMDKPNPPTYRLALRKLKLPADVVAFVGDNLKKDVLGPAQVGMRGVWFNDLNAADESYAGPQVKSHCELKNLLIDWMRA